MNAAVIGAAVDTIEAQGWAILPDIVAPAQVERLLGAVERTIEATDTPFGGNVFLGEHTRRVFNLLSHDEAFAEVPVQADVLAVAEQVLDPGLLLSSLTAVETHPGQGPQPLHADDGSIPMARPHDPLALVAIWALSDFTAHNGATRLVPASHRFDRRPRAEDRPDTVIAEMGAGSVLLYNGSLWHGGGANAGDTRRVFVVCNYCAGWLRQEENQLLGLPRSLVAGFPTRLRELVGYGVYRGLQGHVAGQDPGSWFDDDIESDLVWNRIR